jgi:hypothetical protein
MAQNVERDGHKNAVSQGLGGMKMVDYKKATDEAASRRHFDGSDGSFVTPPRADRLTGADTGEAMSEEDMAALKELALKTTVPQNAPKLERATKPAEAPTEAPAKPAMRPAVGDGGAGRSPFKHFMSDLVPDSVKSDTKSALTSENLWVPLLSGIAAAGASRAPTRGQALSEGVLGATTAYTGLQKQQADTDKKAIETEALRAGITTGSLITDSKGRQFIRYLKPNGQYDLMEAIDFWKLPKDKRPRLDPESERAISASKPEEPPVVAAGTTGTAAKLPAKVSTDGAAPATAPVVEPDAVVEKTVKVPESLKKTVQEKAEALYRAGTGAETAYPDVTTPAIAAASSAQNQRPQLGSLANSLAASPRTESPLASGKVQEIAQPVMAVASNLASMFGLPAPIPQGDMSKSELIKKSLTQLAAEATKSNNQTASASFMEMANAIPNNLNSPDAQAKMLADIYAINQRIIDRGEYHNQIREAASGPDQRFIGQAPHAASAANVDAEFNKSHSSAFYNDEKKALVRMFHEGPTGQKNAEGRQMSWYEFINTNGSKLSQAQKDQIAKQFGAPRVMRYFGLGE